MKLPHIVRRLLGNTTESVPETVPFSPLLQKINDDLLKHEIAGLLFGSASYYIHHDPQARIKDVDVLLLEPGSRQKPMDLSIADRVDYFNCHKRQAPAYLEGREGRNDVYLFANTVAQRIYTASTAFQYDYHNHSFQPGLIIPCEEFFWYLKRIEFQSMKDWGDYSKEIAALLAKQGNTKLTGTYLESNQTVDLEGAIVAMDYWQNNEYRGASHCYSVINYLDTVLKPRIGQLLMSGA